MELLIRNTRIVDENQDFYGDLYIKDGKINKYGQNLDISCRTIDGEGLCLMPAFIDIHAHFRDPGFTYKEDLYTGGLSTLKGGYTYINLMGNTDPICSSMETVDYVLNKAEELDLIDVHQCVSITRDFDGKTLDHLDSIDERIKIITDDGKGIKSNLTMYNAMIKAKEKGLLILSHAEDEDITPIDYRISENIISFRDIYLSNVTGARLHLTHVSTKEAIGEIRRAKIKDNDLLSCDVTPHHIVLWDSDIKVNPPIRQKEDSEEIIRGIVDGSVDTIGTDHAPHSKEDKEKGSPGFVGLETAFPVCYTKLVKDGHIDMKRLSQIMSGRAGEILDINKGKIKSGYDGDLVLVDIDKLIEIDSNSFLSKSKNTPFDGMNFYGEVEMTIRNGEIKYSKKS